MNTQPLRKSVHSREHKALRELFINRRKELNLSQRDLAKRLNVVYSVIGKVETGDRRLDTLETIVYCRALNIELCEIEELFDKVSESS